MFNLGRGCAKCRTAEKWSYLDQVAVVESGPVFLKRCRNCGQLWRERLRDISPLSERDAKREFPSYSG